MATAPVPRLDGAAIQLKDLLFVFAGYGTIDYVRIFVSYLGLLVFSVEHGCFTSNFFFSYVLLDCSYLLTYFVYNNLVGY